MADTTNELLVSFEIKWEDTVKARAEYSAIYKALNDAIQANLKAADWWSENTSFYAVRTKENAAQFLARVWNAAKMRPSQDRIVVLDAKVMTGAAFGHFADQTLFSLLPFVKKLAAK